MNKLYFLLGVVLGIVISISSSSWWGVWLGLELNLMSFVPILVSGVKISSESSMIYFLIQAVGSLILLMFGVGVWCYGLELKIFIMIALLLKVGAAPFHFWYVQAAAMMSWLNFLLLSTVQKIAPLTLLWMSNSNVFKSEIYFSVVMSGLIGGLGGLYSLSLRKLLVYSSINHLGWMLMPLASGSSFWVTYLLMYCILLIMVVVILMMFNIFHLNQLANLKISWTGKMALIISMMSLGGMPPLMGFIPKWGVISENNMLVCLMVLIVTSVINLFYYIHASLSTMTLNFSNSILFGRGKIIFSGFMIFMNSVGIWIYPIVNQGFSKLVLF